METLKNIGKGALVLGIVGALLALAAPPLATMIGAETLGASAFAHAMSTPVIWTSVFFGAFGALHAAVLPMLDWALGSGKEVAASAAPATISNCGGHGHGVTIHNTQLQPDIAVAADVKVDAKPNFIGDNENMIDNRAKLHTQAIEAQRANAPNLRLVK